MKGSYVNVSINPLTLNAEWTNPETGQVVVLDDDFLTDNEEVAVLKSMIKRIEFEERA